MSGKSALIRSRLCFSVRVVMMWCWWGVGGGQHPYCCQANVSSSYVKKKTSHREMKRATGDILSSGGFLTTHTCASARLRTQFRQTGPECGEARPLQTDTYNTVVVFSPHIGRRNQQIAHHFELVFSFFFCAWICAPLRLKSINQI